MLPALTLLLVYQLIGEMLVLVFRLPVPGPVIGMLLLFLSLCVKGVLSQKLRTDLNVTGNGILQHLSLLFIPAGTGIMLHFSRVASEWPAILIALTVSTALALAVTALTMLFLMRLQRARP